MDVLTDEGQIIARLARTTDQIFTESELRDRLRSGRPMRIKYGVDVTAPFMHLGHAVNLWMMRAMQDMGHKVVFLIGDFTTRIGDPTGKSTSRPVIPQSEIDANASEYLKQVTEILRSESNVLEIRRNSEWFGKMSVAELFGIFSMVTYARLIERDMFQARIQAGRQIHIHEMLYPLLQGYDSYALQSDLTIVGTDQLFNEMMGRFFQERLGQRPQIIITSRITPGIDGREKQSKSLGNYIAIADSPRDKFGKLMSIPDQLIVDYMTVYTELPVAVIEELQRHLAQQAANPRDVKIKLAHAVVERYHGRETADREVEWFGSVFSNKNAPGDATELQIGPSATLRAALDMATTGRSKSDLRRLSEQGGIRVNGEKVTLGDERELADGDLLQVGKRQWFKIRRH